MITTLRCALAAALPLYTAIGAEDAHHRRAEARAEIARTLAAGRTPARELYAAAHLGRHAVIPTCPECGGLLTDWHVCKEPKPR
ncbi:hypothetical protein [Actinacidiphila epipremni]|uniref:Uncharacterized protein n=1 Tax=Actinacidiphila epipremni TaxID=2053013 RepID=A0ABX0ZEU7_9ACTN|nr:hypothetical protein [Actinacidiphila epipremni]NJP42304.1 hypothetical protein [Actinacidiphila epipremni]